jgi:hypothetical protein
VELELPAQMRLEPIDARHPDTVALVRGPLVLMATKAQQDSAVPTMTRQQLLSAKRTATDRWQVDSAEGVVTMLPFTSLGELAYTTYVKVV